jgi:PAS domain S-box-containing protein
MDDNSRGKSPLLKRALVKNRNSLQATSYFPQIQGRFSPGVIFAITIGGIVLAEVVAMVFIYYFRQWPYSVQTLIDATIMVVIIFPLLNFLLFKPLLLHIKQRDQSDSILQARLRLMQYANLHTMDEVLQFALDEVEALSGSTIGFFHFLESDQKTILLQAWSTNTIQNMCSAEGKDSHYDVEQAGVWADAVRHREAVIHNNYAALPHRKGTPDGHALVVREIVVPVLRDNEVKAILGLGNKPIDYTTEDENTVSTFADFAWDIIQHKRAEIALYKSEEKFRTFVDWTYDWEYWLDPRGNLIYTSPSCERITGYSPQEFIEDPNLLMRIAHPEDQQFYTEHQRVLHDESSGPATIEYRIISRDGSERWIEHACRPLFGPGDRYLGRRISDRDITKRKHAEQKLIEQNQKEMVLTQTIQNIQTDIARDLHDTLGQNLSFIRMNLEHIRETQWDAPTGIKNQIQNMTKVANESYELIRAMLVILQYGNLSDPLNLFTRYAEQVAERSSIQIEIIRQGNPGQLSPHQTRQIFFIFREALSNIEKYASASRVLGEFTWIDHSLTLSISDDGRGFDPDGAPPAGHYGLRFMRERAEQLKGTFSIQSAPGEGTKVVVVVPLEYEPSPNPQ